MSNSPLRLFDAYDLHLPRSGFDRNHIQETIDYCECRFHSILLAVSGAADGRRPLLERCLFSELVNKINRKCFVTKKNGQSFALSYVGMATACGESLNIPIIIRSLSKDFYQSAYNRKYNIPLDRSFLLALEGGMLTASGPTIDKFDQDWWNFKKDAPVRISDCLNVTNLDRCLEFHKKQIRLVSEMAAVSGENSHFFKPHYIWKPNALQPVSNDDSCKRCRLYRAVALGSHDEQRDIRNLIDGTEVSLSAQKSLVMRRASGFNQLLEYLTIKEIDADAVENADAIDNADADAVVVKIPSPTPSPHLSTHHPDLPSLNLRSNKGKKLARRRDLAETVRQVAVGEVQRLQNGPGLKWTWGIDMQVSDLGNLHRSVDTGKNLPHSDYDTSLPHGSDTRSESEDPKLYNGDEEYFTDLGGDILSVPDLHPSNFPRYPGRHNKKPSRYLQSFTDHPMEPMDKVHALPPAPPYVVPPPLPMPLKILSSPKKQIVKDTLQGKQS